MISRTDESMNNCQWNENKKRGIYIYTESKSNNESITKKNDILMLPSIIINPFFHIFSFNIR